MTQRDYPTAFYQQPWRDQALCQKLLPDLDGMDPWYPDSGHTSAAAVEACGHCPVRLQCLEYAMEHDEPYGVWGGLTEGERWAIKHKSGKTHPNARMVDRCGNGHPYDEANTYYRRDRGGRACRACANERQLAKNAKRREQRRRQGDAA